MTVAAVLDLAHASGIRLWADGDRIRYRAHDSVSVAELRAVRNAVARCRAELLVVLRALRGYSVTTIEPDCGPDCGRTVGDPLRGEGLHDDDMSLRGPLTRAREAAPKAMQRDREPAKQGWIR